MDNSSIFRKWDGWLFEKSGCHVIDFCRKFGCPPLEQRIIALDETDRKAIQSTLSKDKEMLSLYRKYEKDEYAIRRKGNRTWTGFFKDLITGWVLENLLVEMLKSNGIDARLCGADSARVIDIGDKVSQFPDLCIKVGEQERLVEVTSELNQFLEKDGFIEKRSPDLLKCWKNKWIWLYRDIGNGKYILVDFATEPVKLHLRYHQRWGKDVHRYVLAENGKKARNDRMLVPEIISIVGCSIKGKEQPNLEEIADLDSPPQSFIVGGSRKVAQQDSTPPTKAQQPKNEKSQAAVTKPKASDKNAKPKATVAVSKPETPKEIVEEDVADDTISADYDFGDGDFV